MNSKAIGKRLAALRGAKSRKEVAEALKISTSALAMYERGERIPRDEIKIKIAEFFGVPVADIFFETDVTKCDSKEA